MSTENLKFKNIMKIKDPLRVFFLCGTKFSKNDSEDKRNVLKKFIESKYNSNNKVIILEEHFIFGKSSKDYLSYDTIFMKNLKDIELLTGLYSDKIFIIHESISTAAELGMFASDKNLLKKTCLLTPDSFSVEEEKISAFIRLAFFNYRSQEDNVKNIRFYPKIKENIVSNTKSDYHTYFPKNTIRNNLGIELDKFIKENYDHESEIIFKKNKFNKSFNDENIITYYLVEKELNVVFSPKVIRLMLVSIFNSSHFRKRIRSSVTISKTVSILENDFQNIIKNTISHIEGRELSSFKVKLSLNDNLITVRSAIGYFLYMLQALGMIKLPVGVTSKRVVINQNFKDLYENYSGIIEDIKSSKFSDSL